MIIPLYYVSGRKNGEFVKGRRWLRWKRLGTKRMPVALSMEFHTFG